MSTTALLTLFSILIAVWTILPRKQRLLFYFRLSYFDWALIWLAIGAVNWFYFQPQLWEMGVGFTLGPWRWGFTPETVSYAIVVGTTALVVYRVKTAKLTPRNIDKFTTLSKELLWAGDLEELRYLLDRHLTELEDVYNSNYPLNRLRKWLEPPIQVTTGATTQTITEQEAPAWIEPIPNHIRSILARQLPDRADEKTYAREVINRVIRSDDFMAYWVTTRPYFGLKISDLDFRGRDEFIEEYITHLLEADGSVLYDELRSVVSRNGAVWDLGSENRILQYFFDDVSTAIERSLLVSVKKYSTSKIDSLYYNDEDDRHNQALQNYEESGKDDCALHACQRIVDIGVREHLSQGSNEPLHLDGLYFVADKILRNISPASNVNPQDEWLTPYHYLLYVMVTDFVEWLDAHQYLDFNRDNIGLPHKQLTYDGESLTTHILVQFARVLGIAIARDTLDVSYKKYLLEAVLIRLERVRNTPDIPDDLTDMATEAIYQGPHVYSPGNPDQQYLIRLEETFQSMDHKRRYEFQELGDRIENTLK